MKRPSIADIIGVSNALFGDDSEIVSLNVIAEIANDNLACVLISGEETTDLAQVKIVGYATYCFWKGHHIYTTFGVTSEEELAVILTEVNEAVMGLPEGVAPKPEEMQTMSETPQYTYAALTVSHHPGGKTVHLHYQHCSNHEVATFLLQSGAIASAAGKKPNLN